MTATLGGEIDSPTLDGGKTRVKIPSGVQHGKQLRLRGKGMPSVRGNSFGDLYIELVIETPVNLNQKQKDILKEFEETLYSDSNNNPAHNDFFSKVKRFWEKSNN